MTTTQGSTKAFPTLSLPLPGQTLLFPGPPNATVTRCEQNGRPGGIHSHMEGGSRNSSRGCSCETKGGAHTHSAAPAQPSVGVGGLNRLLLPASSPTQIGSHSYGNLSPTALGNSTDPWLRLAANAASRSSYEQLVLSGFPLYGKFPVDSYPSLDYALLANARRKNATRETTSTLKTWLNEHRKNPYPTKGEKIMLAILTKMTLTQVSTWFANARRRLKKENKMTWSPRKKTGERKSTDKCDGDGSDDDDDDDDDLENIDVNIDGDEGDKDSHSPPPPLLIHATAIDNAVNFVSRNQSDAAELILRNENHQNYVRGNHLERTNGNHHHHMTHDSRHHDVSSRNHHHASATSPLSKSSIVSCPADIPAQRTSVIRAMESPTFEQIQKRFRGSDDGDSQVHTLQRWVNGCFLSNDGDSRDDSPMPGQPKQHRNGHEYRSDARLTPPTTPIGEQEKEAAASRKLRVNSAPLEPPEIRSVFDVVVKREIPSPVSAHEDTSLPPRLKKREYPMEPKVPQEPPKGTLTPQPSPKSDDEQPASPAATKKSLTTQDDSGIASKKAKTENGEDRCEDDNGVASEEVRTQGLTTSREIEAVLALATLFNT